MHRLSATVSFARLFASVAFSISPATQLIVASSSLAQELPAPTSQPAGLKGLLENYFAEAKASQRKKIAADIDEMIAGDVKILAVALGELQLWPEATAGLTTFPLKRAKNKVTTVSVRVPAGYDPAARYPVILALHGKGGRAEDILYYLERVLGPAIEEFVIAAPTDYKGTFFDSPLDDTDDPTQMLLEVRKRYRIDTERIYAMGYSMGGHSSWLLATLYTDAFASAIPLAGSFVVPFPEQCYKLLLPNLDDLPVLAVWGERDVGDEHRPTAPGGGIATHNRLLLRISDDLNLPINGVELEGVGHAGVVPPKDLLEQFLEFRRLASPRRVYHYFRFPAQARIGWLRQLKFSGRPWQGSQMAITVDAGVDVDAYITKVLEEKLGLLSGFIDGQYIEVNMTKTAELEVVLNDELLDLDQPITLKVDDKIRFEGEVKRKIETMLDLAYQDWDFQRLYSVRLVLRAQSKARQD